MSNQSFELDKKLLLFFIFINLLHIMRLNVCFFFFLFLCIYLFTLCCQGRQNKWGVFAGDTQTWISFSLSTLSYFSGSLLIMPTISNKFRVKVNKPQKRTAVSHDNTTIYSAFLRFKMLLSFFLFQASFYFKHLLSFR